MVPYTSFSARKSYLENNKDLIYSFTRATQRGLDYVNSHSVEDIAKAIEPQFKDTPLNNIEKAVKSYKNIDAWPKSTAFTENSFNHLQDIMLDYGIIDHKVSYKKLIYEK